MATKHGIALQLQEEKEVYIETNERMEKIVFEKYSMRCNNTTTYRMMKYTQVVPGKYLNEKVHSILLNKSPPLPLEPISVKLIIQLSRIRENIN